MARFMSFARRTLQNVTSIVSILHLCGIMILPFTVNLDNIYETASIESEYSHIPTLRKWNVTFEINLQTDTQHQ